jgi:hypothetical protein
MKAQDMVNQIKNLLGVELSETTNDEVVLAQLQLENGTVLEAESFESGQEIFILTEDEKVALPVGEYMLEDVRILDVQEEGLISEIKAEKDNKEEEEEDKKEDEKEDKEEEKMQYVTKEEFRKEMDELKKVIEEMGYGKKDEDKKEMSEQVSLAVTEILNEEEQLKEELSQPAAEPLKHSPENKEENKLKFQFKKGPQTTQDHVNQMIYNINKK